MEKKSEFSLKKGDWIAVAIVIVLALGTFLFFLPNYITKFFK